MTDTDFDLCVIGGGINGAGIARDAAGRGLRVLLAEAQDLGGATSSSSSKLIHGGLRYLEYHEFRLVKEALKERETLLNLAPHIIWPLEFILPHEPRLRPAWTIRAGLFLYDHLAGRRRLRRSRGVDFLFHPAGSALQPQYTKGFSYADCWVDDARLVVLNARDAAERGALILPRTVCTKLAAEGGLWRVFLKDTATGREKTYTATMAVNATGPWVRDFLESSGLVTRETPRIRLVKGSHIVVPRLYEGGHAYILQQPDQRIVFALPYERDFTLIGTTEADFCGGEDRVAISQEEVDYLCGAVNRSFRKKTAPADIVWTYSGIRPLLDDGHESATSVTRDYRLVIERSFGPLLLSVFGGKITTYRRLAEQAVDDLCGGTSWTDDSVLPGGNLPDGGFELFVQQQETLYPWLPEPLCRRYARSYGTRMDVFLENAQGLHDLGRHLGDDLYEAEVYYLVGAEWARTAEDILWRRTKLGLHVTPPTVEALEKVLPQILRKMVSL